MEPVHYLRALRQWWLVIAGLAVVGALAAALLTSTPAPSYQATHTLVVGTDNTSSVTLSRAAFLTTNGQVPRKVAAILGSEPAVSVVTDSNLNGLQIIATADNPDGAVKIADTYAEQLVGVLDGQAAATYQRQLNAAKKALSDALAAQAAAGPNPADSLRTRVDDAQSKLQELQSTGSPSAGFSTIGTTAVSIVSGGTSRTVRVLIGGLVGLMLGIFVALLLARFDTRIRTREAAETALGAPVLAEVPLLPRKLRRAHTTITIADPESLGAEAYRGLRTAVLVTAAGTERPRPNRRLRSATLQPTESAAAGTRVVMVASPGMGEGKTTTTANLAVAFAETGRSVLVLGCDLRRPELHEYFGLSPSPGLTELLRSEQVGKSLETMIRDTNVPGVRMVTSGHPVDHPGELLSQGIELLTTAREHADVVVVDTAPLLATDDASLLIPMVDDVVLVCRAGLTPKDAGQRAQELLARLRARVAGVVLIGAQQLSSARSYYRSDYRSRSTRTTSEHTTELPSGPEPDREAEDVGDAFGATQGGAAQDSTNGVVPSSAGDALGSQAPEAPHPQIEA